MPASPGLHHVTAITGDPTVTVEFYASTLGLRLVKRTVNFDDPGTLHLYFGDAAGSPGTLLTFFPWSRAARGRRGSGEVSSIALDIPEGSTDAWRQRLERHSIEVRDVEEGFDERAIAFDDPFGMRLELVERPAPAPAVRGREMITGLHAVTLATTALDATRALIQSVLGYALVGEDDRGRLRLAAPGGAPGRIVDLVAAPGPRPTLGTGSVHHVALRCPDAERQRLLLERLREDGRAVTPPQDRIYFQSIYFREPGGTLFEIATDGPGFAIDEPADALGQRLMLPPWLEARREEIERRLEGA